MCVGVDECGGYRLYLRRSLLANLLILWLANFLGYFGISVLGLIWLAMDAEDWILSFS